MPIASQEDGERAGPNAQCLLTGHNSSFIPHPFPSALTGHSAKQFSAAGKKDLAYACIYAYVRFLVWLKMGELEFAGEGAEESGYYVMQ